MPQYRPSETMTVIEAGPDTKFTGLLDSRGNPISVTTRKQPIGFVWLRELVDDPEGNE